MARNPLSAAALARQIETINGANFPVFHTTGEPRLSLTYRFETMQTADFPWNDVTGLVGWNAAEQQVVLAQLQKYAEVANIHISVARPGDDADLSFFQATNLGSSASGRGRHRFNGDEIDGSVVFRQSVDLTNPNRIDFILHEIGHMFGLKHPGDFDIGGNNPSGPFLPDDLDNRSVTLLSSRPDPDPNLPEFDTLRLLDIAAIQAKFGGNGVTHSGNDVYEVSLGQEEVIIWDGGGVDTIQFEGSSGVRIDLRPGSYSDIGGTDNLAIAYNAEIEKVTGGGGDDTLLGSAANNTLTGRDGDDRQSGGGGRDRLLGSDGDDTLDGGLGDDTLKGQADDDRLLGRSGEDVLVGSSGNDFLSGGGDDDRLRGGGGNDRLIGGGGDDRANGGSGNDRVIGRGGEDNLRGQAGDDTLSGGGRNDTLDGGTGGDVLTGGGGSDLFVFASGSGSDVITDFQDGSDRISIIRGAETFEDLTVSNLESDATVSFADVVITLRNVDAVELSQDDFLF